MKKIVKQIDKLSDSLNEVLPPAEFVALLRFVIFVIQRINSISAEFIQYLRKRWIPDCNRRRFHKMTAFFCPKFLFTCPTFENFLEWLEQTGTNEK